jgi:uncharacterized protein (TIGR00369 family)
MLVGMRLSEVGEGEVAYVLEPSLWLGGLDGLISSSALAYFADAPVANAIHSLLKPWKTLRTVQMALNYHTAIGPSAGPFTAQARMLGIDGETGLSEVHIAAADGTPMADGTCRCVIIDAQPQAAEKAPRTAVPPVLPYETQPPVVESDPGVSGLDTLQQMIDGEVDEPAFWQLLGCRPTEVEPGRAVLTMKADPWLSSPAMLIYGGAVAAVGQAGVEAAMSTADPPGARTNMLDCTFGFTRSVPPDGTQVVAEARLVHRGRTLVVADGEVLDSVGRRVAVVRATGLAGGSVTL